MTNEFPIVGAHMSVAAGLEQALIAAWRYRCRCVQMFVVNQRQWQRPALTDEQVRLFRRTRRQTHIAPVVVHASYLINLAAADRDTHRRSLAAAADELQRCERLRADYYVLHPGAHRGRGEKRGLDKIVASLDRLFGRVAFGRCRLLLETTAGAGSSLGWRFEQLAYILEHVEQAGRLGVCLDTSHVFAAGYDIRSPESFDRTLRQLDRTVKLARLKVIHANDSRTGLNSRRDRHEHIGKGALGRQAFRNFLTDRRTRRLPFILETPKGTSPGGRDLDRLNLNALRRLAR
ncbi:MAG: deoxyribonuclease IV [Sedimentisphaerales bacterium]|nr:deoxyribonuclease IV [Sedimentisphaerales bacterium]